MKMRQYIAGIGVVLSLLYSAGLEARNSISNGITRVSMVNLIATPHKYNHKKIQVEGFAHMKFEDKAAYLSPDDAKYLNTVNAVWLDVGGGDSDLAKYDDKWVLIEGDFDAKTHGHMGLFLGAMKVTRMVPCGNNDAKAASSTAVEKKISSGDANDFTDIDKKAAIINDVDLYVGMPNGNVKHFDRKTLKVSETVNSTSENQE